MDKVVYWSHDTLGYIQGQGRGPHYNGELSQQIADLIARIKMGGGAGVKSELNFCLYCHARLSSLSVSVGYMREGICSADVLTVTKSS